MNRLLGLALLAVAVFALASCGGDSSPRRYITYTVTPSERFLTVGFQDTSDYPHTVWFVVDDPRGRIIQPFAWQAGYDPGMMSAATGRAVRSATYRYAVYVADGEHGQYDRQYWTSEYLFGDGAVTVP